MATNETPVYLFTGFLEGGKTHIIQESLSDPSFNTGEKTLILMCEEGEEELDPSMFAGQNCRIEYVENQDKYLLCGSGEHKRSIQTLGLPG